MTEETTAIQATHGPYAGQRLTMSKSEAAAAIADGWAVDPFKPPEVEDPNKPPKEPKQLTEEERGKIVEKAHQAAIKLRGEDKDHEKDKSMKPQHEGGYETRDVKPQAATPAPPARPR